MKKNYILVLMALLSFALYTNAQENDNWETVTGPNGAKPKTETYNMVVTLPDGSTFTVNTEDVDEVSFEEGQVNLTGKSVSELLEDYEELLAKLNDLRVELVQELRGEDEKVAEIRVQMAVVLTEMDQLKAIIDQVVSMMQETKAQTLVQQDLMQGLQAQIDLNYALAQENRTYMYSLNAKQDKLVAETSAMFEKYAYELDSLAVSQTQTNNMLIQDIALLKAITDKQEAEIKDLVDAMNTLYALNAELQVMNANLQVQMDAQSAIIDKQQDQIAVLEKDNAVLKTTVADLQAYLTALAVEVEALKASSGNTSE